MKLRTFYVRSYRSIVEATLDNLQQYSVIVGPNNSGKSNLLRAIYISLSIALDGDFQRARRNRQYSYAYRGENYNWARDIPILLKHDKNASTTFKLTFEFNDEEKADFKKQFGINLSKSLQISTHSPILVDRNDVTNNVVISNNHRVVACQSIEEVRETLGVRLTDNLAASKVVLVEGESDKRYLEALCKSLDAELYAKIEANLLRIENVHSASKMDYQVRLYNGLAISTLVLLDMDDSGMASYEHLISSKTKPISEILQIKSAGMDRCELEDIVDINVYSSILEDEFNININIPQFMQRKRPWSDRLHIAANKSPGVFAEDVEARIKTRIADIVVEQGIQAIAQYDRDYIQSLIRAISRFAN